MTEKHLKKCSTSLVIREMQTKTTLRFHLTPVRMAKVKNSGDSRCWQGCGERGTLLHCWWDCRLIQPFWKSVWGFPRKLDIALPENSAIPLLGMYPRDAPTNKKRHMLHYVHNCLIYFFINFFINMSISYLHFECYSLSRFLGQHPSNPSPSPSLCMFPPIIPLLLPSPQQSRSLGVQS